MPLDPLDEKRLADLERDSAALIDSTNKLIQRAIALGERLKVAEGRNRALWTLSTALFLTLLGAIGNSIQRAATIDAIQSVQAKREDSLDAAIKELAKEFHEHERRASTPKPEK